MKRFFARLFILVCTFAALAFISHAAPSPTYAQTSSPLNSVFSSNVESDVSRDIHSLVQIVMLETLSTLVCQLSGIDPLNPSQSCLGINPLTNKIGYAPQTGEPSGLIGLLGSHIGTLYTVPASSTQYTTYMAGNFGIVKSALAQGQAQGTNIGSAGLAPLLPLWKIARDIAYSLLILAFIFIGVAVMLRVKVDPRTVMTVQNQIPRVIISILLITFSYAIAGLMVDLMWTTTYIGINSITNASNPNVGGNDSVGQAARGAVGTTQGAITGGVPPPRAEGESKPLSQAVTQGLFDTPIGFFNTVYQTNNPGIFHVTQQVAKALGGIIKSLINDLFSDIFKAENDVPCINLKGGVVNTASKFSPAGAVVSKLTGNDDKGGFINWDECARGILGSTVAFIWYIVFLLIILITILVSLYRIWFALLKAYLFLLFYIFAGPIWIVFGLLPGRPLGFENWMRNLLAKTAVFPLTAILLLTGRVLMDAFNKPQPTHFIPPLVGNPSMENFGTLLGFGTILMAPTILSMLEEKLKTPGAKQGAAAAATLGAGAAIASAVPKRSWAAATARDQQGRPVGPVASWATNIEKKVLPKLPFVPGAKGRLEKSRNLEEFGMKLKDEHLPGYARTRREDEARIKQNEIKQNMRDLGQPKSNAELKGDAQRTWRATRNKMEAEQNKNIPGIGVEKPTSQLTPEELAARERWEAKQNVSLFGAGREVPNSQLTQDELKRRYAQDARDAQAQTGPSQQARGQQISSLHPELIPDRHKNSDAFKEEFAKQTEGKPWRTTAPRDMSDDDKNDYNKTIRATEEKVAAQQGQQVAVIPGEKHKPSLLDDMRGHGTERATQSPAAEPHSGQVESEGTKTTGDLHVARLTVDEFITKNGVHPSLIPQEHLNDSEFVQHFSAAAADKPWRTQHVQGMEPLERGEYEALLREVTEKKRGPHTA